MMWQIDVQKIVSMIPAPGWLKDKAKIAQFHPWWQIVTAGHVLRCADAEQKEAVADAIRSACAHLTGADISAIAEYFRQKMFLLYDAMGKLYSAYRIAVQYTDVEPPPRAFSEWCEDADDLHAVYCFLGLYHYDSAVRAEYEAFLRIANRFCSSMPAGGDYYNTQLRDALIQSEDFPWTRPIETP